MTRRPCMLVRAILPVIAGFVAFSTPVLAQGGKPLGFYLNLLPKGKNVTIPKPATTFVPLTSRVRFTATDLPQSLSFTPVNVGSGAVRSIRISIYDPGSERVKYANVLPGTPFLYTFRSLGSITIVPEGGVTETSLALQVESNKPLEIAH